MRKSLEAISLVALLAMAWMTWYALNGPEPLPSRIPIHFDAAGNPNSWGSPSSLLGLVVVAVVLYLGISLTARFPSAFNFPAKVTAENRPRLEALALDMIAWMKMEMVCIFAGIQWFTIKVARQSQGTLPLLLLPICFVAFFGVTVWYIVAMAGQRAPGRGHSSPIEPANRWLQPSKYPKACQHQQNGGDCDTFIHHVFRLPGTPSLASGSVHGDGRIWGMKLHLWSAS